MLKQRLRIACQKWNPQRVRLTTKSWSSTESSNHLWRGGTGVVVSRELRGYTPQASRSGMLRRERARELLVGEMTACRRVLSRQVCFLRTTARRRYSTQHMGSARVAASHRHEEEEAVRPIPPSQPRGGVLPTTSSHRR